MIISTRKEAVEKGHPTYYTGNPCPHNHIAPRRTHNGECIECRKIHLQKWYVKNPDKIKEYAIKYAEKASARYYKNIEHSKKVRAEYVKNNKDIANAKTVRYQTAKKNRLPKWVGENELWMIKQAYELAEMRSTLFGFSWHVDHIIPLQGKYVSGLHTITNLQVIPGLVNTKKANKWVPV